MLFAYIDPATGAMILQIVAATVLASGVFFRKILISPLAFLFRRKTASDPHDSNDDSRKND